MQFSLRHSIVHMQVLLKLRQTFGSVPIPIVMCTAMSAGPAVNNCLRNGATDVLLKPYERAKVIEVIQRQCGAKVGACMCVCMRACVHACACVCACTHAHACVCVRIRRYVCMQQAVGCQCTAPPPLIGRAALVVLLGGGNACMRCPNCG